MKNPFVIACGSHYDNAQLGTDVGIRDIPTLPKASDLPEEEIKKLIH